MNKKFTCLITSLGLLAILCFTGLKSNAQTLSGETMVCSLTTEEYATETGQTNYVWNITGGTLNTDYRIENGGTITDNTITIQWITPNPYTVSINYAGGTTFPLEVTVNPKPTVSFGYFSGETPIENVICHNIDNSVRIVASSSGTDLTFRWFDNEEDGATLIARPTNTTSSPVTMRYPIFVRNTLTGCTLFDTANIVVNPTPNAGTITGDNSVCESYTVQLSNAVTGGTWESLNTSVATVNATGLVTSIAPGTAEIRYVVSNTYGCSASAIHSIIVKGATTLEIFNESVTYDRNPKEITRVHVKFNGTNVGDPSWVTYEYFDANDNPLTNLPVEAGTYRVVASFNGNETYCPAASSTATLTIRSAELTAISIDNIPNQAYTGGPITPTVVVKHGTNPLTRGTEFTVDYVNNINVGMATAKVRGIGNYSGEVDKNFYIVNKANLRIAIDSAQYIIDNDKDKYNDGSMKDLEEALSAGVVVFDDPNATQEQIDNATMAIMEAIDKLIECIPFDSLVSTHWNNTLTVNNNKNNNGGYTFQDNKYQWFRKSATETDFTELSGQTNQYYSAGPKATDMLVASDRYYVTMFNTQNEKLSTCAGHPNLTIQPREKAAISVYPNPVSSNNSLSIDLSNENSDDLNGAVIEVYSALGTLVSSTIVDGSLINIDMPNEKGIYLIKVRAQNFDHVEKVVVK